MIFQHTWQAVLSGEKTQTRRLVKIASGCVTHSGVIHEVHDGSLKKRFPTYQVDHTYAVQPAHTKPAIWWRINNKGLLETVDGVICYRPTQTEDGTDYDILTRIDGRVFWQERGFKQARIRITNIRLEDVRRISAEDVKAEGFGSYAAFMLTWVSMYDKRAVKPGEFSLSRYINTKVLDVAIGAHVDGRPAKYYQAWALTFELVTGQ